MSEYVKPCFNTPLYKYSISDFTSAIGFTFSEKDSPKSSSIILDKLDSKESKRAICSLLDALLIIDGELNHIKECFKRGVNCEEPEGFIRHERIKRDDDFVQFSLVIEGEVFEYSFGIKESEDSELIFKLESTLNDKRKQREALLYKLDKKTNLLITDYYQEQVVCGSSLLVSFICISIIIVFIIVQYPNFKG